MPNKPTTNQELDSQLEKIIREYGDQNLINLVQKARGSGSLFDRKNMVAHCTTQAFVVSSDKTKILLLEHLSLGGWYQPGGHIDSDDSSLWSAAKREAAEESGLIDLRYLAVDDKNPNLPMTIQINPIPENSKKQEGEHKHIDLSYLFAASPNAKVEIDKNESSGSKWISLEEFYKNPDFAFIHQKIREQLGFNQSVS
jgi:8-oxo-dGTP pyrophosphatase MutT (NUDIX family)